MRIFALSALLFTSTAPAYAAAAKPSFAALAATMTGRWNCKSGAQTYTTTWTLLPNSSWIRGINVSQTRTGTSMSEDMETYDAAHNLWRIVDMEPNGNMSVLAGSGSNGHVSTQSVYPDTTQHVRYDRVSSRRYTLTFDFIIAGKHSRWVDTCDRAP